LDLAKLLGFEALNGEAAGKVDLQGEAFEAKLGAKVGAETWTECEVASEFPDKTAGPLSKGKSLRRRRTEQPKAAKG
jgi:hypothetical protein